MRTLIAILILALAGTAATTVSAADAPRFSVFQRQLIEAYARDQERISATATRDAQAAQDAQRVRERERDAQDEADRGDGRGHGHGHGPKGLPPGIAMNLERGKSLPPGIAKQRLPESLAKSLPAAPKGKEIVVVDGRVLLIDSVTRQIHDRIENVLLR